VGVGLRVGRGGSPSPAGGGDGELTVA
jgi:hypothetical protein